jgi:hypothetical protein
MNASLLTGKAIHRSTKMKQPSIKKGQDKGGSPNGYGIKVPKCGKPKFALTPREIQHES